MVDERLGLSCRGWHAKYLYPQQLLWRITQAQNTHMGENFLRQSSPFSLIKGLIKTEDASTPFQAIASHLQLIHRMHILDV
jgi:hypothetical protein